MQTHTIYSLGLIFQQSLITSTNKGRRHAVVSCPFPRYANATSGTSSERTVQLRFQHKNVTHVWAWPGFSPGGCTHKRSFIFTFGALNRVESPRTQKKLCPKITTTYSSAFLMQNMSAASKTSTLNNFAWNSSPGVLPCTSFLHSLLARPAKLTYSQL